MRRGAGLLLISSGLALMLAGPASSQRAAAPNPELTRLQAEYRDETARARRLRAEAAAAGDEVVDLDRQLAELRRAEAADDVLYQAIRSVQAGQLFLPACMAAELWQDGNGNNGKDETVQASRPLSEQETKVLTLIARGFSNAEIAAELVISVKTVETYKARLLEKLNVTKPSELVKYAIEQGLL